MQGRPRQVRDRRLQGVKAVVERQQGLAPEGNHHRFLVRAENGRARVTRPGLAVLHRFSLAPFGNRLGVDPELTAQLRGRSLRLSSFALQTTAGQWIAVLLL